jgi:hypothetical protein
MRALESSSDASGNSSKKISTTGARSPACTTDAWAADGSALAGSTSLETGETVRNRTANTTGAGPR